jgi:hypothetical protein
VKGEDEHRTRPYTELPTDDEKDKDKKHGENKSHLKLYELRPDEEKTGDHDSHKPHPVSEVPKQDVGEERDS